jgi:NAD(P)-dependent dehydrogenase (short-subunit alcohol dehydrogenase family)
MPTDDHAALKMPSLRLDGKTAMVTGAGRGLGRACAFALAAAGAEVVLVSRTHSELEAVAALIHQEGGTARPLVCDVTDSAQVHTCIAALERLDVLVNNAGSNIPEPFVDVSEDHLDFLLTLNVRAMFIVAQAAARKMMVQGQGGVILHMSSQMGHTGAPNRTVYCMTKHAIEGLTKAMGVELAPHGIRVNSIAPTFFETPLARPFLANPAFRDSVLSKIAMGRLGQMEDIMGAVVYLASPAAAMVTGTSLVVDGGWTAH